MKILVGLDLVDCARFEAWGQFSDKALRKIFSPAEIAYCRHEPLHSASRCAVRFAAREALYKALHPLLRGKPMPFLLFCRSVEVIKSLAGVPCLTMNREILAPFYDIARVVDISLSLSHTPTTAGAVVIIIVA